MRIAAVVASTAELKLISKIGFPSFIQKQASKVHFSASSIMGRMSLLKSCWSMIVAAVGVAKTGQQSASADGFAKKRGRRSGSGHRHEARGYGGCLGRWSKGILPCEYRRGLFAASGLKESSGIGSESQPPWLRFLRRMKQGGVAQKRNPILVFSVHATLTKKACRISQKSVAHCRKWGKV